MSCSSGVRRGETRIASRVAACWAALLSLILLSLACPALAQDLYIVGGTLHPISAPPATGTVVISGDRILAVDPDTGPGPTDRVIDATGQVVTPGFVEFSTQVGLVEIWAVSEGRDTDAGGDDEIRAGFRAVDALNPYSTLVPITRRGGVTSVVTHPSGGLISGQSVWWDLAGDALDEMVVLAPATMDFQAGASGSGSTGGSRASAMLRFRELFMDVAAYNADPTGYNRAAMRDLSASLVDLEALGPVLDGSVPVFVLAHRQADILAMLRLADEHGLRMILGGAAEAWAVADELAARHVPVVVDPLRNAPYSFEELGTRADAAALLDRAGVPVILSTETTHNARLLRQFAGNAVRAGMDYDSALAAVTVRPAEAAGLADQYGTIEPGRVANLVIWSGDPFELSTQVIAVIVRGREVSLETRQTRLLERYRDLVGGRNRPPGGPGASGAAAH